MNRIVIIILVLAALLFPLTAAARTVPRAADCIGEQLDEQLMARYASDDDSFFGRSDREAAVRAKIMIMGTTPANLNNLQQASPLARQMTEEISRWLINKGYRYDELRKGANIRFDVRDGEFILTRRVPQLATTTGVGQAILAGTYVVSSDQVRFNMSLINACNNEVLAKATATVPITPDLIPLLRTTTPGNGMVPSVYTRLQ